MASLKTLDQVLADLRTLGTSRTRPRLADSAPLIARLAAPCKTLRVEEHAGGFAFRLEGATESAVYSFTFVLHHPAATHGLTIAEKGVAALLCEGRTLAQIAYLRGVSVNTVKSQVRQVFRKLDVGSRVALVRRLCP
jgi:DNA-binding CsgD family transcriptional regulator